MCVCSAHIQENERGEGGRLVKTRSSIHITHTHKHRRAHVHVNTEKGARVDGFEWNCDDDCGNTNKGLSLGQLQCSFYVGTRETHAQISNTVFPSMPSFCFYQSTEYRGEELGEGKRDATVVVDGVAMRYNFVFFDLSTLRNGACSV